MSMLAASDSTVPGTSLERLRLLEHRLKEIQDHLEFVLAGVDMALRHVDELGRDIRSERQGLMSGFTYYVVVVGRPGSERVRGGVPGIYSSFSAYEQQVSPDWNLPQGRGTSRRWLAHEDSVSLGWDDVASAMRYWGIYHPQVPPVFFP